MKKFTALVFLCIVSVLTIQKLNSQKVEVSSLLLNNIEALAAEEHTSSVRCIGSGSLDCPASHDKVKYILSGYSLESPY